MIAAATLAVGAGVALAAPGDLVMQAQRWTAPGKELELLSTQPVACLTNASADEALVQAGQALFNTPMLLGGQAAKSGLNCAACHVNGRDNPHFLLAGISGAPGTADVTSSFFSTARHNAIFDPVAIPDLAKPGKISRDPQDKALEAFIRNLIVDEFSGAEPTPATLQALATYVRAIGECRDHSITPHALTDQLALTDAALTGTVAMQERSDDRAAKLLIGSARHQLGLIHERYAARQTAPERRALLKASRELQAINDLPYSQKAGRLVVWRKSFENDVASRLIKTEKRSLYSRDLLAKHLGVDP